MKVLVLAAAAVVGLVNTPAHAQSADTRSFMHPLGVWSNEGFVAQRKVYHDYTQALDELPNRPTIFSVLPKVLPLPHPDEEYFGKGGGGLIFERNW